jgi:hypothetical protein
MKPALLALAVILACAVYELDRESRFAADWHTQLEVERLLDEELRGDKAWMPAENGSAYVRSGPSEVGGRNARTGSVEREQSIRLFGPGVSRRQQIRV